MDGYSNNFPLVRSSNLAQLTIRWTIRIENLRVDGYASNVLVSTRTHEHQIKRTAMSQRRKAQDLSGTLSGYSIGETANRIFGVMHRALTFAENHSNVTVEATIFVQGSDRIIRPDDHGFFAVYWIAAMAHPENVPV